MSYSDEYDEFSELPIDRQGLAAYNVHERTVRKRSSKGELSYSWFLLTSNFLIVLACDQCRKSKCKCERSGPNELCKSCAMLGTRESNILLRCLSIIWLFRKAPIFFGYSYGADFSFLFIKRDAH